MSAVGKAYRRGTHRLVPPRETIARIRPLMSALGITRIANVTGLDHIGIPVVVVCRPNSRSLSVSQGKGLGLDDAKASGLMESLEAFHAERIARPLKLVSYRELRLEHATVDPESLPSLSVSRYTPRRRLLWVEGIELASDQALWVPYEMVHLDLTLPLPEGSGCFPLSSNGLASGNSLAEAICHGVCELVERDANALWLWSGGETRDDRRLDLDSVSDPGCRELLERFERAGMLVGVWDITSDVGIAAFRATIIDRESDCERPLYPARGMGCHPAREIALARALTEAAQSRLTRISSSRDDVAREDYELTRNPDLLDQVRCTLAARSGTRKLRDAPTWEGDTFEADLEWLLGRLREAGLRQVIAVDLSRPGLGLYVVRIIVPGLEGKPGGPGYVPGARARAVSQAHPPAVSGGQSA